MAVEPARPAQLPIRFMAGIPVLVRQRTRAPSLPVQPKRRAKARARDRRLHGQPNQKLTHLAPPLSRRRRLVEERSTS